MKMSLLDSFPFPPCKTVIESSCFLSKKSRHEKNVKAHPFNHAVEVLLPGCSEMPEALEAASPDEDIYYLCEEVPVVKFTDVEFIDNILKIGHFSAMSVGCHIDNHDVVAVLPSGELILSVEKDTYMELGLQGHPSKYTGRKPTRYIVEIDLLSNQFRPGQKTYNRVRWSLTDRLDLKFNFLLSWKPKDSAINIPSRLSSLWPDIKMQDMSNTEHSWRRSKCSVPIVHSGISLNGKNSNRTVTQSEDCCSPLELFEWVGAVSCQCNQAGNPESFANTYCCPEPMQKMKHILCQRWSGFISSERIQYMLSALRTTVTSSSTVPWAALTIHGFDDAPVSWRKQEHGYHKSGCNNYTFIVFPDDRYLLYIAVSTHDEIP